MVNPHHVEEWSQSGIHQSLIELNLLCLEEEQIAEWYFQYLPNSARRNDGRIRDGYLRTYREPLKGGWGIAGYDPTDWQAEPELRSFKPDNPRIGKDGKPIKYDVPKNAKHNPILARVSHAMAANIFRSAGLSYLELTKKYAPAELITDVDENSECCWFWRAVEDNSSIPISITEGGKKAQSLLSVGRCAIAVSSITTWRGASGSHKIHPWLALFAPFRRFYLTFDQDIKQKTKRAVNGQCLKLGTALISAGATRVQRISWSGTAKGIDDFIFMLHQKYGVRYCQKILRKCYENARSYRSFGKSQQLPGIIKKVNKQYLSVEDVKEAANCKILVVKSAKGTNKTGILSELVERDRALAIPTINLSHLERLARELGHRLDLPYRTEQDTISLRNAFGYSLCLDSFSPDNSVPFHPEQWQDAGLAIDEFTQGLHHLAFGNTELKKYRKLVLATLAQKLADCWQHNKPIRLLDADANPESIELIYELIQLYSDRPITREELEANTFTLINEYRPLKGNLYLYNEPSPKQIRAELTSKMKNKERLFILSSSQKSRSGDGTINLEKLAIKHYKPSEILRIDSQTTSNPEHPAFGINGEHLSNLIKAGIYQVIIASPTICTGISIDDVDEEFDAIFSFQAGNLTTNSVRQQLVRCRDFQVDRHLWCPKVGKSFIASKSTNPIELLTEQKGEAKLSLNLLGFKEAEKLIESNICPLSKYWARVGASINSDNYHYREILLSELEEEGWNVKVITPDSKDKKLAETWLERKNIQAESVKAAISKKVSAQDITKKEAEQLERRKDLTENQQAQLDKFKLKQKYSVEELSTELIEADFKKLYPALRLKFWLTVGRPYVESADRSTFDEMKKRSGGQFFIPDFNQKTNITKVKLLEMLKLKRFTVSGTEWHNKSPELIELKEFVLKDLVRFNQILRCGIARTDSPITVIQKILKAIGESLTYLRNERDGDKRLRIYGAAKSKFALGERIIAEILNNWFIDCQSIFRTRPDLTVEDRRRFTSGAA